MDYSYNYGYLQQYMVSHGLAKKDLLEAFGSNDYISLNRWLDGKVPVHITAMLRFCNYYNVPLGNFFFDGDGQISTIEPPMPDEGSQILPTDGYGIKEGRGRGIVHTRVTERSVGSPEQARAVAQGLANKDKQHSQRESKSSEENYPAELANPSMTETLLRIRLEHSDELRKIEQSHRENVEAIRSKFDSERERLMGIIEQQSREIARLSSPQVKRYDPISANHSMVADVDQ